jgi:hypothetical protein
VAEKWIIKTEQADEYPYLSAPGEGSAWGPDLQSAYRFDSEREAWREVGRLEQEHKKSTWKYLVRRVVTREERLRDHVGHLRGALSNLLAIAGQYVDEKHGVITGARDALQATETKEPARRRRA